MCIIIVLLWWSRTFSFIVIFHFIHIMYISTTGTDNLNFINSANSMKWKWVAIFRWFFPGISSSFYFLFRYFRLSSSNLIFISIQKICADKYNRIQFESANFLPNLLHSTFGFINRQVDRLIIPENRSSYLLNMFVLVSKRKSKLRENDRWKGTRRRSLSLNLLKIW